MKKHDMAKKMMKKGKASQKGRGSLNSPWMSKDEPYEQEGKNEQERA